MTIAEAMIPKSMGTDSMHVGSSQVTFSYESLEEAFPKVDPGVAPFGSLVLVQIRQPKRQTRGGIILTAEDRATEFYNTQIAMVRAIGPVAFHNRNDMTPWPEKAWCQVGDFVRVPKYQGDRFSVPFSGTARVPWNGIFRTEDFSDEAVFVLFKDLSLLGKYTADPLAVKAYV